MGITRKESTTIGGVVYTTETYTWSEGADIYAQLAAALPDKILALIMLPVSESLKKKRKARAEAPPPGDGEEADESPEALDASIGASILDLVHTLETPGVLAKVIGETMKSAADIPGGIADFIKGVLFKTSANPIRIAPAGGGHKEMVGGEGMLVPHIDNHFSGGMNGMRESLAVAVWVLRTNFVEPSSGGS